MYPILSIPVVCVVSRFFPYLCYPRLPAGFEVAGCYLAAIIAISFFLPHPVFDLS